MRRVVNLTKHPIRFVLDNGTFYEIEATGHVARVGSRNVEDYRVEALKGVEIPVYRVVDRELMGLPEPREGVLYITSGLVAAIAQREDVASPMRIQRDPSGKPTGFKGLLHYNGRKEVVP